MVVFSVMVKQMEMILLPTIAMNAKNQIASMMNATLKRSTATTVGTTSTIAIVEETSKDPMRFQTWDTLKTSTATLARQEVA